MKKCILSLLICAMAIVSIPCTVYANEVGENGIFGIVTNSDGEVVRTIPMPVGRNIYVDTGTTLQPGETLTTYQYKPVGSFFAGFRFWGRYDDTPTTPDRRIKISVYNASSVGGTRYVVSSHSYSTNIEENSGNLGLDSAVAITLNNISAVRPYYNAEYTNLSSSSLYLNFFVGMD